ncbi:sce7726 family protein [Shewanella sp. M16]|uniref:sce7726 family protein n=1 Tax=Shewanella sp. M16 TaxID=2830837 RepID=UPI001BB0C26E|nr:sce7726 family protein [Shewanella sp. M16]MBS0044414.1 sce7726 family protein [Shewanella sp. M16]
MKEIEIKRLLVEYLMREDSYCVLGAEVAFQYGSRRADIVSISGVTASAYEIKGAGDSVERLGYQIESYKAYFDCCYIVCEQSNLLQVRKSIGREVGILLASESGISKVRRSRLFKRHDKESLASTISVKILRNIVSEKSIRSKHELGKVAAEQYSIDSLRKVSREELIKKYSAVTRMLRGETSDLVTSDDILTITRMPPDDLVLKS